MQYPVPTNQKIGMPGANAWQAKKVQQVQWLRMPAVSGLKLKAIKISTTCDQG